MLFVKVQSLKEELEERSKQLETAEDKVNIYQSNVLLKYVVLLFLRYKRCKLLSHLRGVATMNGVPCPIYD